MADPKEMDEESDVEMEGIDMDGDDDEADDAEVDEIEAEVDEDADATSDVKVDEHELEELEAARKERMDLMYARIYHIYQCMYIIFCNAHDFSLILTNSVISA